MNYGMGRSPIVESRNSVKVPFFSYAQDLAPNQFEKFLPNQNLGYIKTGSMYKEWEGKDKEFLEKLNTPKTSIPKELAVIFMEFILNIGYLLFLLAITLL